MTGGSHIRAVGPEAAQDAVVVSSDISAEEPLSLEPEWEENWEEEPSPGSIGRDWVLPAAISAGMLAWTVFFGWAFRAEFLSGGTPQQWAGWIINWSVPILLLVGIWLLVMRTSTRESARFADAAASLSRESVELETRLTAVNRELSLAREFLASQSLELDSLGRIAAERISTHAGELESLIHRNGEQIDSIASVSDTALENMRKLRDDLPVVANSAKDVSSQIGNAGNTAHERLAKLVAGFERLNEFGQASERQVGALSTRIAQMLETFERQIAGLGERATGHFDSLKEQSEEFRVDLEAREVDILAAMRGRVEELRSGMEKLQTEIATKEDESLNALRTRLVALKGEGSSISSRLREGEASAFAAFRETKDRLNSEIREIIGTLDELDQQAVEAAQRRIKELHEEAGRFDDRLAARDLRFNEEIAKRQDEFDTREAQASEILGQRLAALDDALAEREEAQLERARRLSEEGERIAEKVSELNTLFDEVAARSNAAGATIGSGLENVSGKLAQNNAMLEETGETLVELTEASIRLLEIIQSGAKQSREDLPRAIAQASSALTEVEERAVMLQDSVEKAGQHGRDLSGYIIETKAKLEETADSVDDLFARLSERSDVGLGRIESLRGALGELSMESEKLTEHTQESLRSAIIALDEAARSAFATLENGSKEHVGKLAEEIGAETGEALERSLKAHSAEAIGRLEQAAAHAAGVGREAAIQLRDQLAMVNELAGNLEQRVNRARELAEERVDNDFARRMALITDSLNSNAIDISKALSEDVTDTSWASYLKGDRGIFTRRAVRLIDNTEAREIVELYENDDRFREHVSRYIHEFEAMLRSVLSTRDGNALSVTLLGSDMGKLYVALAQAIERLRN